MQAQAEAHDAATEEIVRALNQKQKEKEVRFPKLYSRLLYVFLRLWKHVIDNAIFSIEGERNIDQGAEEARA